MDRYRVLSRAGDGTYGTVWAAVHRGSGDLVAVKRFRRPFASWADAVALREVRALRALRGAPGVVALREVVREDDALFLVFEHMDCTLHQHLLSRTAPGRGLPPADVARWGAALFAALDAVHGAGLVHRDIKPENLLLRGGAGPRREGGVLKLADFGLARSVPGGGGAGGRPRGAPCDKDAADPAAAAAVAAAEAADGAAPMTAYVSTRWYRAPEVLLRAGQGGGGRGGGPPPIGPPCDVFAAGLVLAEMLCGRPLFPGATEADQLGLLARGLGPPSGAGWGPAAAAAAAAAGVPPAVLGEADGPPPGSHAAGRARAARWLVTALPPGTPRPAIDFLASCLAWDPAARPTAAGALAHPFLAGRSTPAAVAVAAATEPRRREPPAAAALPAPDQDGNDPFWMVRRSRQAQQAAAATATATVRVGGSDASIKPAPAPPRQPGPLPCPNADLAGAAALLTEAVELLGRDLAEAGPSLAAAVEAVRARRRHARAWNGAPPATTAAAVRV